MEFFIPVPVEEPKNHKISVYLNSGQVYEYETDSNGREHSSEIMRKRNYDASYS